MTSLDELTIRGGTLLLTQDGEVVDACHIDQAGGLHPLPELLTVPPVETAPRHIRRVRVLSVGAFVVASLALWAVGITVALFLLGVI